MIFYWCSIDIFLIFLLIWNIDFLVKKYWSYIDFYIDFFCVVFGSKA